MTNFSKERVKGRGWPLSCRYSLMLIERLGTRYRRWRHPVGPHVALGTWCFAEL